MAKPDKQNKLDGDQPQPGMVISPGSSPAQPSVSDPELPAQAPAVGKPELSVPAAVAETQPAEQPEPQDPSFEAPDPQPDGNDDQVTWTASEFIAHDKSLGWYAVLALVTLALAAAAFFVNRDFVSVSVVIIGGLLLGVYAGHQPRPLDYMLNSRGLSIGRKHYAYDNFKSFSIMKEGAFSSIMFMPLKRFAVGLTVHYAPEDEEKILSILTERLPMEDHRYDLVDNLMRRIRF